MMSPDQEAFVRIVTAMRPYLDQLVFVGAWCHRLLQFHPGLDLILSKGGEIRIAA